MRLLIASTKPRFWAESMKFAEAPATLGVKTICVNDKDYYCLYDATKVEAMPLPLPVARPLNLGDGRARLIQQP